MRGYAALDEALDPGPGREVCSGSGAMATISVLIPTYNCGRFITEAVGQAMTRAAFTP
jgi:hypothetical protein